MDPLIAALLDILRYTLPAVAVVAGVWVVLQRLLDLEKQKTEQAQRLNAFSTTLPLRVAAYERLVLLLERLEPPAIVSRLEVQQASSAAIHNALVRDVNEEFEHNIVQQVYVSEPCWMQVQAACQDVLTRIQNAYEHALEEERKTGDFRVGGAELLNHFLGQLKDRKDSPNQKAIRALKAELRQFFSPYELPAAPPKGFPFPPPPSVSRPAPAATTPVKSTTTAPAIPTVIAQKEKES
jgi:hypothetical protein